MKFLLCLCSCAVMATCSYSKSGDQPGAFTGAVVYELPTGGYAK